jgi:hypothetical protein
LMRFIGGSPGERCWFRSKVAGLATTVNKGTGRLSLPD